jgi:hypothetical protein
MASGRSLPENQRSHRVSLASGRPERCRPRYSRPAKTEPICCHPVLPQAVACHGAPPMRDHYRQTAELRVSETDCASRRCSWTTSVFEQPRRELSSTDARAEKRMCRFKSARHAQRFVEVHGIMASHFRPRRHLFCAADYGQLRSKRFRAWNEATGTAALA